MSWVIEYTHMYLARSVVSVGSAAGDTEIEKYFDMSVELRENPEVLSAVGNEVIGTETITALMLAQRELAKNS
jgi:hypothetical protein